MKHKKDKNKRKNKKPTFDTEILFKNIYLNLLIFEDNSQFLRLLVENFVRIYNIKKSKFFS